MRKKRNLVVGEIDPARFLLIYQAHTIFRSATELLFKSLHALAVF